MPPKHCAQVARRGGVGCVCHAADHRPVQRWKEGHCGACLPAPPGGALEVEECCRQAVELQQEPPRGIVACKPTLGLLSGACWGHVSGWPLRSPCCRSHPPLHADAPGRCLRGATAPRRPALRLTTPPPHTPPPSCELGVLHCCLLLCSRSAGWHPSRRLRCWPRTWAGLGQTAVRCMRALDGAA